MKIGFIQLVALLFVAMLSMASYAGGAGCDSKKGHGKHEMSAEAAQEFKDNHAWLFSEKSDADAAVPGHEMMDEAPQPAQSSSDDMVEI